MTHNSGQQAPKTIPGVGHVARDYDAYLLDQFGVLHNGKEAYPAAVDAVRRLAEAGKTLVIISNSSRRSSETLAKLEPLGMDPRWFSGVVTSGELTHAALLCRGEPAGDADFAALGSSALHLTWGARGAISLEGLRLRLVQTPEAADFVLAHGLEALGAEPGDTLRAVGMDDIRALLQRAAELRLPLVIANPDEVTVAGASLVPMPGALAPMYRSMGGGGGIVLMGKPHPRIYAAAQLLCGGAPPQRILAVGDSLTHDVAGANAAGIDCLFVAGGIHAAALGVAAGRPPPGAAAVEALAQTEGRGAMPTYWSEHFSW